MLERMGREDGFRCLRSVRLSQGENNSIYQKIFVSNERIDLAEFH